MYKAAIYVFFLVFFFSCNSTGKKNEVKQVNPVTTTYYLIRHAEKDRSDSLNKNPELTPKGIERAKNWAVFFDTIHLDQIYASAYQRCLETARYTAEDKFIYYEKYDPSKSLYTEDFKLLTEGNSVLIVGHSNTVPTFVNEVLGEKKYPDMEDNDNSSLFVVTDKNGEKNVEIFKVN